MTTALERKEMVVKMYKDGIPGTEIARANNIGKNTVYKILKREGLIPVEGKRNRFSLEQEECIVKEYIDNKMSLHSIAKKFNCNFITVRNVLLRHNCEMKKRGNITIMKTEQELENIKNEWISGVSQTDLAKKYGVGQTTMSRFLAHNGITQSEKQAKGPRHSNWIGGRAVDTNGYVYIKMHCDDKFFDMAYLSDYVPEHRLVMAKHLNRSLTKKETVHHINGNRSDNRIENLQLRNGVHGKGQCWKCQDCGSTNVIPHKI